MDTTKVYIACTDELNNDIVYGKLYSLVPKERQKKADRLVKREDKNLCVASFVLLQKALENESITDFEVLIGSNGKPYLKEREDVFFSISHSGNVVMCAVSPKEVGCDIQKIKDVNLSVCERFFSKEETEYIKAQKDQNDAFIRVWTLKESYAKLTGKGLESGFDDVKSKDVCFKEFDAVDGYRCSVCFKTDKISDIQIIDIIKKDC